MSTELPIEQMAPKLLRIAYFDRSKVPSSAPLNKRYAYDYEIEYTLFSKGGIMINDVFHKTEKGSINLRKPGQKLSGVYPSICYTMVISLPYNAPLQSGVYSFGLPKKLEPIYTNEILDKIPDIFTVPSPDWYSNIFKSILDEHINHSLVSDLKIRSLLLRLIYQMYIDSREINLQDNANSPYSSVIRDAKAYIYANYANSIDIAEIAYYVNLSTNYFHKIFLQETGKTPGAYLSEYRIKKAKELLAQSSLSVCSVAESCGFESSTYFNYVFKKHVNSTPMKYRKQYQNDF